jgi:hypothetical protein
VNRFPAGDVRLKQRLTRDGSIVVCVLAELENSPRGIVYGCNNALLMPIVERFCGSNCPEMLGKPKIFLFLDQRVDQDGLKDRFPLQSQHLDKVDLHN